VSERAAIDRQAGFSLLELVVVMGVSLLFSSLILFFTFEYWRLSATLNNDSQSFVSRLNAGDRLRDAINESSGLIIQNSLADSNTGDPDPSIATGDYWIPLHAIPGNTAIGASGTSTPLLYFKSPSTDASKNVIFNGELPYEDEFVLYLDGTTKQMRLRTLANQDAPSNHSITTCPAALVSSTCPIDRLIVDNIASVDLRYFSRSGNLLDYTSIVDPDSGAYIGPDMPAVEVVELTLRVNKKSTVHGGADTSSQTIIRVALRNS
jgi:prepilin-type N-terminal cleavage/methylation domain-containing protein